MSHLLQSFYQELLESNSESNHERLSYTKTQKENKDNYYNTITSSIDDTLGIILDIKDSFFNDSSNKKYLIETLHILIEMTNLDRGCKNYATQKIYEIIHELQGIKRNLMLQTYGAIVYKVINNKPIIIDGIRGPQTNEIERRWSGGTSNYTDKPVAIKEGRDTPYKDILTERARQFEEKYTKLSNDDFYADFNNTSFNQGRVGNCYFLGSLRGLMENQYYSLLIKTSVSKESTLGYNGERKQLYRVYIPLGEPGAPQYTVYPEDVGYGVKGSLGVQILEAAYMKHVTGDNQINSSTIKKMNGGIPQQAIETICGKENISTSSVREDNTIKSDLLQFDPQNTIICMGSAYQGGKTDSDSYHIKGYPEYSFYYSHAYSVLQVDKTGSTINSVMISNPHDAGKGYRIPYDVFKYAFLTMNKGNINKSFAFNDTTKRSTVTPQDNKRNYTG